MRLEDLLARLETDGLLMLADTKSPSVVSLVVGGAVKGSWWGHPKGREIYALAEELGAHKDVLAVKLVRGKLTFVHRRLWPMVLSIARARDAAQLQGLSPTARRLLARVDKLGELEARGPAVKELELRLLVHSGQVHTKTGTHALVLTSWTRWAKRHAPIGRGLPLERARQQLQIKLDAWN